jgi:hypothetical protein
MKRKEGETEQGNGETERETESVCASVGRNPQQR